MSADPEVDISVAIVTFNNSGEITACLTSLARDLADLSAQIILIDNASTDGTLGAAEYELNRIRSSSTRVEIGQNPKNLGFTRALNLALHRCVGDFVLTLNPDTELISPCLPILLQLFEEDESLGIVAPQLLNANGSVQRSCRRFPRRLDVLFEISGLSYVFAGSRRFNRWKMGDFDHNVRRFVEQPQGAFLLFRRSLLQSIGVWDEQFPMFFSDVDWCLRIRQNGYGILFEPAARVLHRKGASIYRNRVRMIWTSHHSFYYYFKKHQKNILLVNELTGFILLLTALIRAGFFLLADFFIKIGRRIFSGVG